MSASIVSLATTHPEIAAQWHPTLNGDITPWNITHGSNKKVWWECKEGTWPDGTQADDHVWEATINSRTRCKGCSCCTGKTAVPSNCLATTHPEIAAQWHPTLNGDITPWNITHGSNKKVWWECKEGTWPDGTQADDHVWETMINNRSKDRGRGCSCCSGKIAVPSNCLATTHPEIAAQWHPTLNGDDITPWNITHGCNKKVWWECKEGTWPDGTQADDHVWEAIINSRSRHRGCSCCTGQTVVPSNCLATTHPEIAAQWHPTLNGDDITPWNITHGSDKKVWWECKEGTCPDDHVWKAKINHRTKKSGCPYCSESKGEKAIRLYLEEHLPKDEWEKEFRTKTDRPDYVLIKLRTIVEFQGVQHYEPLAFGSKKPHHAQRVLVNCILRDWRKLQRSRKKGWPILFIPYWDLERIPEILHDVLAGRRPKFSKPPASVNEHAVRRKKIRSRLGINEPEILWGLIT
jgi:hypothetical protein